MIGIIVAFPKADVGEKIKSILARSGFDVVSTCTTGSQVIREANGLQDGVVLCSLRLPDMMYHELKEYLPAGFRMIVITSKSAWKENGAGDVVSLSQPIQVHELISTAEMVVGRAQRLRKARRKQPTRRSGEERALIDRAKDILMSRNNMTEPEAHRYLQKTSMDNGTGLTETAQMILSMTDK